MVITYIIAFAIWCMVVAVLLVMWIRSRKSVIAGKPVLRQTARISLLPQLFVMGVLAAAFILLVKPVWLAVCLSGMVYLALSFTLERCIPRHHRRGMLLCKQGSYIKAIEAFQKSYDFFCRHAWIDKYRYLTLLSASKASYTEMALVNIAFCYVKLKDVTLAIEYYQRTLVLFPDSEMAKGALKIILNS